MKFLILASIIAFSIGIIGVQESFAQEWGYGESNVIKVQGIDYKISGQYSPDTVPYDGYEEGILSLRVFDRNSNQTAKDVTLRIEILRDGITLAKNIYFDDDGTIKITVQPNSQCDEEQVWYCTTYSGNQDNGIAYATSSFTNMLPTITGPVFDKPGIYKIKMTVESMRFEDKNHAPLNFGLSIKLGGDTFLSNNYQVYDRRIQGLMEYSIPYEMNSGEITGVDVICTGASMVVSMDNSIPTTLTMTIPKLLMYPDSHDYDLIGHNENKFNILSENSEAITVQIQIDEPNAIMPIYFTSQGLHPSSWETKYCPFDRLRILEQPPNVQIREGVPIENVTCYKNLVKIFKSNDNSPACVKSKTAEKLIERGWVKSYPIWAERTSIQCETWGDTYSIKEFYENQEITVIDTQTINTYFDARCEACGCLGWDTHYISVPSYNIEQILQDGWSRSKGPEASTIFQVDAGDKVVFDVEYSIKAGILKDITKGTSPLALLVKIDAIDNGEITLKFPRELIDDTFIVLINGDEVDYQESAFQIQFRELTIDFKPGDLEIEIISVYYP